MQITPNLGSRADRTGAYNWSNVTTDPESPVFLCFVGLTAGCCACAGEPLEAAVLELSVDEVLTTTRAVRRRLDLERPVPRAVIEECLDLAFQAPNGSNQQFWQWIFVEDPATKAAMADIYSAGMDAHIARPRTEADAQIDY